jgi:EAL domain-containing protein (putative c-di-GMP-specific phosphodiesterase class I)
MAATSDHDRVLSRLREHGIRLAIDDFGTGYCSLDYLRRYPANRVKIASTFITHIASDAGSATIVKAITALANQLGMVPIAEGIETAEQLKLVTECSCPEGQGFYFARPLGLNAITVLLRRGNIPEGQTPARRLTVVASKIAS